MMTRMEKKVVITGDGSHSIFVPDLNEHYHSIHGAVTESRHVFILNGLNAVDPAVTAVRVLEVGFGTGLNALLTWEEANMKRRFIEYTAIEPLPLDAKTVAQLNYPLFIDDEEAVRVFPALHQAPWNKVNGIGHYFRLHKIKAEINDALLPDDWFHCIYYDAFGPEAQPGMWTYGIFNKMASCLRYGGILVTYCAKGSVRRMMKRAGFRIESLPGAPGKKEMSRTIKMEEKV
jgi:tRNA U34 5-methylaminomethyl-2-thiouridine-forming methyltransferase MnmC